MERFLHLPLERQAQAFQQGGAETGWPEAAVEKDFWVTLMLRELFALPPPAAHLTFKGGTSLSKVWKLIDRFSEDIDLTLDRDALGFDGEKAPEAATGKERKRRLDRLRATSRREVHDVIAPALSARLSSLLPIEQSWSLLPETDGDDQTLIFTYPRSSSPQSSEYLRPAVKLEFGARSDPWPVEAKTVMPLIAQALPVLFDSPQASVRALLPERTFWEKALLLHEEQFRPSGRVRRARMARHYYDLWRLIESGVADRAAKDAELFERVVRHREVYFRHTWVDYSTLRRGSIQILPSVDNERSWREDYEAMRSTMFMDEPPPFSEMLAAVSLFQEAFNHG